MRRSKVHKVVSVYLNNIVTISAKAVNNQENEHKN